MAAITEDMLNEMVATVVQEAEPERAYVFGFHAQQAVGKALRCRLCSLVDEAPKTHDPEQLVGLPGGDCQ